MKKTSLGLKVRAVSQNRPIARAMGIQSSKIDAITFGIGSGIAGVAGVAGVAPGIWAQAVNNAARAVAVRARLPPFAVARNVRCR